MDEVSVTRPSPSPTRAIVADDAFCVQVAAVLHCDEEPIYKTFIGEPVEEVLVMVRWALSHQDDEGFNVAKVLTNWAQKRERGAWSTRPRQPSPTKQNLNGKLAEMLVQFWSDNPHELVAVLDQVEQSLNGSGRS
jgi:hypothetical protein